MKKKYIQLSEFQENIKPMTQISFGTVSPFRIVSYAQDKILFGALYGNTSYASGPSIAIGTLEVCRRGDGTVLFDFESYKLLTTSTSTVIEVVGPLKPSYHWSTSLPPHLNDQAPVWVKEVIRGSGEQSEID